MGVEHFAGPWVSQGNLLVIFSLQYKSIPFTFVHWLSDIVFVLMFVLVELSEKKFGI